MDGWQKSAFFYSVPPVSPDCRFFNEVVEVGDMLWSDWPQILLQAHHSDKRFKHMKWGAFTLANTKFRLEMKIWWSTKGGKMGYPTLEIILNPLESLSGKFNLMWGFALWNPSDLSKFVSKYDYVPKYTVKKNNSLSFSDAVPLTIQGLTAPTLPVIDQTTRGQVALYVRLELPGATPYPLTGPDVRNRSIAVGPGVVYQMENKGKDTQDSSVFDYEGVRWRLFYQKKPTVMLLLQRMPADDPRNEIGDIEVEFDLIGVKKGGEWVKESMDHVFPPGFSDWGEDNPNFKKAEWFLVRVNALNVNRNGPLPPSAERYAVPPAGPPPTSDAGPPPGPPPGQGQFAPPSGPPPGQQPPASGTEELPSYSLEQPPR